MTWQVNDLIPWVKNMWRGRGGGNRREEKKREVRREERLIHWIDYPSEQSRAELELLLHSQSQPQNQSILGFEEWKGWRFHFPN